MPSSLVLPLALVCRRHAAAVHRARGSLQIPTGGDPRAADSVWRQPGGKGQHGQDSTAGAWHVLGGPQQDACVARLQPYTAADSGSY